MDGNVVIIDMDKEGNVFFTATGTKIGHMTDEYVRKMITGLQYDMLGKALVDYVYRYEEDHQCCAECGSTEFYLQKAVDGVRMGFCRRCNHTHLISNIGVWYPYPDHPSYRRRVNTLTGERTPATWERPHE